MRKPLCEFARSCYDTKILPYTISLILSHPYYVRTSRASGATVTRCARAPGRLGALCPGAFETGGRCTVGGAAAGSSGRGVRRR